MSGSTPQLAIDADGVATITLARPAHLNRLHREDLLTLQQHLARLRDEPSARALVLTGEGRVFCAGFHLGQLEDAPGSDPRLFEHTVDALEALPLPTVARLNGSVYGGATDLALCCDIRIGSPGLKMFVPAAMFGLHFYASGLRRYVTRLGLAATSKLMLTAMTIESDEMLRIGFLSDMVPREALGARVDAYLEHIARSAPAVVAQMKRHLHALAHAGLESDAGRATMASIAAAYRASLGSDELRQRLARTDEKRQPSE